MTSTKNTFYWLVCPTCNRVPSISHHVYNDDIMFDLHCNCSKTSVSLLQSEYFKKMKSLHESKHQCTLLPEHKTKPSNKYCKNCTQWLCDDCIPVHNKVNPTHLVMANDFKFEEFCYEHKTKAAIAKCKKCSYLLCKDCCKKHQMHKIEKISDLFDKATKLLFNVKNQFEKTKKYYKEKNLSLKKRITDRINEEMNTLVECIDKIEKAYDTNCNLNEQLEFFVFHLIENFENSKPSINSKIINNLISNTQFHQISLDLESSLADPNYNLQTISSDLVSYYKSTHIVSEPIAITLNKTLTAHKGFVYSIKKISENIFVSSSSDGTMKFWDINEGNCITSLSTKGEWIYSLCVFDSEKLISGLSNGDINIWNISEIDKPFNIETVHGHSLSVTKIIKISKSTIASCSYDKTIKIWDIKKNRCLNTIKDNGECGSILLLKDGRLVSASSERDIKFYNVDTMKCENIITDVKCSCVNSMIQLYDERLAVGDEDKIKIFNVKNLKLDQILSAQPSWVLSMIQLKDGSLVMGCDSKLIQYNMWNDVNVQEKEEHKDGIRDIIAMKDNVIISCSDDNTIKIWKC